ncbi:hypothetical protein [Calditerrivibrio nitroreducens]|uniref:Uncharacterized protein n=1 Tax=Calditerrivibrio nitroreducens (strain DSM 19672 / NBRC 101217 / Yu37-1) TaxID=768670 RepID=E4TGU2_CALNY|nr:hypothetical protein [Calditerrivibrio nitroreducens]ADR18702.1 hypothetical protein Calni_0791 [Calditerrivibrio nitroreducens DSM 19672]
MFDLTELDAEIKQLKAETLSDYGKRIEIAIEMLRKKEQMIDRERKIASKIKIKLQNSSFLKRKTFKELLERVDKKIITLQGEIDRLKALKGKYIDEYKTQREYLGLYDHEFVEKFFEKN